MQTPFRLTHNKRISLGHQIELLGTLGIAALQLIIILGNQIEIPSPHLILRGILTQPKHAIAQPQRIPILAIGALADLLGTTGAALSAPTRIAIALLRRHALIGHQRHRVANGAVLVAEHAQVDNDEHAAVLDRIQRVLIQLYDGVLAQLAALHQLVQIGQQETRGLEVLAIGEQQQIALAVVLLRER